MGRTKFTAKEGVQSDNDFNILTNDPSLTAWGWAIVNQDGIVKESGCIKTESNTKKLRIRAGDDRTRRISELNDVLIPLIKKWNVKYILSELPHGSQNYNAAVMVGMVPGIVETIKSCFDIGVEWYSEADSKKCALGRSTGEKLEMVTKMKTIYTTNVWTNIKYIDEAVADALAVHYIARKQSNTLKFKAK